MSYYGHMAHILYHIIFRNCHILVYVLYRVYQTELVYQKKYVLYRIMSCVVHASYIKAKIILVAMDIMEP